MTTDTSTHYHKKDLLDSEETAHWLGLKTSHTLEVWRSTKRYPELEYIKVGRLVRYKREAIERFLAARTVGGDYANA